MDQINYFFIFLLFDCYHDFFCIFTVCKYFVTELHSRLRLQDESGSSKEVIHMGYGMEGQNKKTINYKKS